MKKNSRYRHAAYASFTTLFLGYFCWRIEEITIPSSHIFYGPRGTGKTLAFVKCGWWASIKVASYILVYGIFVDRSISVWGKLSGVLYWGNTVSLHVLGDNIGCMVTKIDWNRFLCSNVFLMFIYCSLLCFINFNTFCLYLPS